MLMQASFLTAYMNVLFIFVFFIFRFFVSLSYCCLFFISSGIVAQCYLFSSGFHPCEYIKNILIIDEVKRLMLMQGKKKNGSVTSVIMTDKVLVNYSRLQLRPV